LYSRVFSTSPKIKTKICFNCSSWFGLWLIASFFRTKKFKTDLFELSQDDVRLIRRIRIETKCHIHSKEKLKWQIIHVKLFSVYTHIYEEMVMHEHSENYKLYGSIIVYKHGTKVICYSRVTGNPINRSVSTSDECLVLWPPSVLPLSHICKVAGTTGRINLSLFCWKCHVKRKCKHKQTIKASMNYDSSYKKEV